MIAIIDADFIIWKAVAGKDVLDIEENRRPDYCTKKVDLIINSILKEVGATSYIGYLTSGRKSFRYNINPTYKANRKDTQLPEYFHLIKDYITKEYGFKQVFDLEADDACMITYRQFVAEDKDCIVVAEDKDLIKCCEGKFYRPAGHGKVAEFIYNNDTEAYINFWMSMICGDNGDNLCGLPGKGKVWFTKNILELYKDGRAGLQQLVLQAYLTQYYPQEYAIDKFYECYKSLKIIDSLVYSIAQGYDFSIPEPVLFIEKQVETEEFDIDKLFN